MPRKTISSHSKRNTSRKSSPAKKSPPQKITLQNTPSESMPSLKENIRNPRLWIGLGVVVLAILLYAFKGLFVAAVVNGTPISRLAVIQQLEQQNGKQALNTLVTQQLIMQEAQKRHITITQADINSELSNIESSLKSQGVTLDQALASRGLSKQDLIQQISLQKMIEKMVGSQVKVTDAQVQDYIDKNQDSLPQGLSDDQLKAQVRQQLEQQQLQDKTQTFVDNLQKNAKISYFVNY